MSDVLVGSFADVEVDEPWPGVRRRAVDSERATVTEYEFEPGGAFPLHRHPQEQITLVERGTVTFSAAGEQRELKEGDWSVVAPEVEHGITAGAAGARILAIIVPRREGRNAYSVVE